MPDNKWMQTTLYPRRPFMLYIFVSVVVLAPH